MRQSSLLSAILAILAMLSLLQKSKGNESQFKELETLEDYFEDSFIWNDHCSMQSLITSPDETSPRFHGKDRYLDNEKSAQDRIANSISEQKRPNEHMDVNAAIRQDQAKRRKGSSGRIKRKPSKVKSVITGYTKLRIFLNIMQGFISMKSSLFMPSDVRTNIYVILFSCYVQKNALYQ